MIMKDFTPINLSSFPATEAYSALDIVGNTIGRYFDYKKEAIAYKEATKQVRLRADVEIKKIDAELKKELVSNKHFFMLEIKRLKVISQALQGGREEVKMLLKQQNKYIEMIQDKTVRFEIKQQIPTLIAQTNQLLSEYGNQSIDKIRTMQEYHENTDQALQQVRIDAKQISEVE